MFIKIDKSNSLRLSNYLVCDYRFTLNILKSRKVDDSKDGGGGGAEILGEF